MQNRKILISGAGIAGCTLAYFLKKRGFSPLIIEKCPFERAGGYKVDIRGAAIEVVKRMGIYEKLLAANVNLSRSKFILPDGKIFEFDGDFLGLSSEGEIEVNRWDLIQMLTKKIGSPHIIYGDFIKKIDGKRVDFDKMDSGEFDIIIGADGQFSNVRRLAFGDDSKYLKNFHIQFCVFPIPNIFELDRCEVVYFEKGMLATAYAVKNHSYACLAFKSEDKSLSDKNRKMVFEKRFGSLGWKVPHLISLMNESDDCYFNTIAQVRMQRWSKDNVVLVGDAAYSAQGMGTSLAITGAYILARELEKAQGNFPLAFTEYEKAMRKYVEDSQKLAEGESQLFTSSSIKLKLQLYLMKILPKKCLLYLNEKRRVKMKAVAGSLTLEQDTLN